MIKRFCDLCGAPGADLNEASSSIRVDTDELSGCDIRLTTHFWFVRHPAGIEKEPDLCAKHANELIAKLKVTP